MDPSYLGLSIKGIQIFNTVLTDEEIAGVRWGSVGVCICLWREGG